MSHQIKQQDTELSDRPISNPHGELLVVRESIQELSIEALDKANGGWAQQLSQINNIPV